jgi:hypothetical protein
MERTSGQACALAQATQPEAMPFVCIRLGLGLRDEALTIIPYSNVYRLGIDIGLDRNGGCMGMFLDILERLLDNAQELRRAAMLKARGRAAMRICRHDTGTRSKALYESIERLAKRLTIYQWRCERPNAPPHIL